MALKDKHAKQIEATFAKYPDKRSAVMPLLHLSQQEYGWVSPEGIGEVAGLCEMDPTQVRAIAGFYTMYSEEPMERYWFQFCTDRSCAPPFLVVHPVLGFPCLGPHPRRFSFQILRSQVRAPLALGDSVHREALRAGEDPL